MSHDFMFILVVLWLMSPPHTHNYKFHESKNRSIFVLHYWIFSIQHISNGHSVNVCWINEQFSHPTTFAIKSLTEESDRVALSFFDSF